MNQALYAHMNNKTIKINKNKRNRGLDQGGPQPLCPAAPRPWAPEQAEGLEKRHGGREL
jgi:hypothetical protein